MFCCMKFSTKSIFLIASNRNVSIQQLQTIFVLRRAIILMILGYSLIDIINTNDILSSREPMFLTIPEALFKNTTIILNNKSTRRVFLRSIRNNMDQINKHQVQEILLKNSTTKKPTEQLTLLSQYNVLFNLDRHSLYKTHSIVLTLICFLVVMFICVTIIGNLMVCITIFMVRKLKQQPANLLLVSLAMADFSVGLLVMPIALLNIIEDRWILGMI